MDWKNNSIQQYPEFIPLYGEVYAICKNVERVTEIFSEELQILDRNTVRLMIDDMQDEIDGMKALLGQKDEALLQKDDELLQKDNLVNQQSQEIKRLKNRLEELTAD